MSEPELEFHDTVPIEEENLQEARDTAKKQKAVILEIFRQHPLLKFTAYEMWLVVNEAGIKMLQNSVRRSITDLCEHNTGRITMCPWSERKMGEHGRRTRTWRYNTEYIEPLNKK